VLFSFYPFTFSLLFIGILSHFCHFLCQQQHTWQKWGTRQCPGV